MSLIQVYWDCYILKVSFQYGGLFCNSCLILQHLMEYMKVFKKLPDTVDTSDLFNLYKENAVDITVEYFKNYKEIDIGDYEIGAKFENNYQFKNYKNVNYTDLKPFIKKYFSVSENVEEKIKRLESKYKIDYSKMCVLFYRGLDKCKETKLCSYMDMIEKARDVLKRDSDLKFLIQSDEAEFIEKMEETFPDNSVCFKDEIRYIPKCMSTVVHQCRDDVLEFSKWYLAITVIMSRCKYIVCTSGNCSIWIMLYRGNGDNVDQYLEGEWV